VASSYGCKYTIRTNEEVKIVVSRKSFVDLALRAFLIGSTRHCSLREPYEP